MQVWDDKERDESRLVHDPGLFGCMKKVKEVVTAPATPFVLRDWGKEGGLGYAKLRVEAVPRCAQRT